MPLTSSRGPRRGFYWQDWYAAWMLLRCWRFPAEGIEAIELEASNSPHIDDIVVYRSERITYYQLKRVHRGPFTGSALFREGEGPPLLAKLFKGWRGVRAAADRAVEVVLATNASLSSNSRNRPISPADFNRNFLAPLHRDRSWRPGAKQQDCWQQLKEIAGARSCSELAEFLHTLRLKSDEPSEGELRSLVVDILQGALRPGQRSHLEADAWVSRVYDLATEVGVSQPLSKSQIEVELHKLFRTPRRRLEHILALPENHIPRRDLAQSILEQARQLERGYLLVTGPPGSGKTTLATWLADSYPEEILLRYHVFHPKRSADIERSTRATALSFVTELLEALADRFPRKIERYAPATETVAGAIDALWIELGRLKRSSTAIIVVDGIDHVFRASQRDGEMLFASLRRVAPLGVVFVLFGQPGWPYPAWIRRIDRIEVPPFTLRETESLLTATFAWDKEDPAVSPLASELQDRTGGNPLSLFYALSALEKFDSAREASSALSTLRVFGDKPHEEYELLLDHIENQVPHDSPSFRRDFLAWLAVALAPISLERMILGFSEDRISERTGTDVLETLRPVLVESRAGEFRIFHDDFRRFAEAGLSSSERKQAHARHARALRNSFRPGEIRAFSEHLWFAELFEELSGLPGSRELADWLVDGSPDQVGDLFRLSCAATLKCGSDAEIIASCLACKLALDASPSWYQNEVSWRNPSNLKAWSFVPPPEEMDRESLERCKDALVVAANQLDENPALAETVANRFSIPDARWPDPRDDELSREFGDYLAAWATWLLRSGRPEEVGRLVASTKHEIGATLSRIEALLEAEADSEILAGWIAGLASGISVLDRGIIKAALRHLVGGRAEAAGAILRSLSRELDGLSVETRRDTACLLCLLDGSVVAAEHAEAQVRFSSGYGSEGAKWREFFFAGMVEGYLGRGKEPQQFSYSESRRDSVKRASTAEDSRVAELCWRCGVVAGVVKRAPGLVRVTDVLSAARPFLEGHSDLRWRGSYPLSEAARIYLPLLACAVSGVHDLATTFGDVLFESAGRLCVHFGSRPVGVTEALWILSPDRWREIAVEAISAERLPESDYDSRHHWFSFWRTKAGTRGIVVPRTFDRLASISLLGVYRKTYPTSLAIELLGSSLNEPDFENRLRQLVDVLIQVDKEPEGGRAAFRGLPQVLGLALISDGSLFVEEFHRTTSEATIAQPFDSTRGSITRSVLGLEVAQFTPAELVALWHWVAASPGGDEHAEEIAESISQRLRLAGEEWFAASIETWATTVAPAQEGSAESRADEEVSLATENLVEEPARVLSLKVIEPRWFSSWWSREEAAFLGRLLAEDPENWGEICSSLAENLAGGVASAVHLELVAEAIPSLRPDLDSIGAFQAALRYLRMRARFQEEPFERVASGESYSFNRIEALVRLTAEGLEAKGVEVVRRALRALAAMGQHPELCAAVEAEAVSRLSSSSDRTVAYALVILRRLSDLSSAALEKIQTYQDHRNAWCRWLACTICSVSPEWSDPPILSALPGPISLKPVPSKRSVGALHFSDPTSVREIYVRRLRELTGFDEAFIRERIELEYRSLRHPQPGSKTMIPSREGPGLTEHGMGSAAARAISGLLVGAPPQVVSPMLSLAAHFDPWLALSHPYQPPRDGWIELAVMEERIEERKVWHRLRTLCVVARDLWGQSSESERTDIGSIALRLMVPNAPDQYAWISEAWESSTPATFAAEPIQPLAFFNQPFTELTRDRFQLVPRWDLPIGAGLRYDNRDRPSWRAPEHGTVIEAIYEEWKGVRPGIGESPSWRAGWFISPVWLKKVLDPISDSTTLISCCRIATGARTEDSSDEVEEVHFSAEEVDLL